MYSVHFVMYSHTAYASTLPLTAFFFSSPTCLAQPRCSELLKKAHPLPCLHNTTTSRWDQDSELVCKCILMFFVFMLSYHTTLPCDRLPCLSCKRSVCVPGLFSCPGTSAPVHETPRQSLSSCGHRERRSLGDVQPSPAEAHETSQLVLYRQTGV